MYHCTRMSHVSLLCKHGQVQRMPTVTQLGLEPQIFCPEPTALTVAQRGVLPPRLGAEIAAGLPITAL